MVEWSSESSNPHQPLTSGHHFCPDGLHHSTIALTGSPPYLQLYMVSQSAGKILVVNSLHIEMKLLVHLHV